MERGKGGREGGWKEGGGRDRWLDWDGEGEREGERVEGEG